MEFIDLNDDNFVLYAAKHYENPTCSPLDEFYDDLQRFKYIKRLFSRYEANGELRERLILNHLIVLYNVFGIDATTRMLLFRIDQEYYSILKTFLVYLNYLPNHQMVATGLEEPIITKLRNLQCQ